MSILTLRAARQGSFGTDDVFGAQVARANAQVIQQALRERNDIERKTEIEIKQRDIDTAKLRLDLDRDLALCHGDARSRSAHDASQRKGDGRQAGL